MTLESILMIVGIVFVIISFFIKDRSKKVENDLEELSINIYQETNGIKRRLKLVEEELMLDGPLLSSKEIPKKSKATKQKPIHSILVSQVLELGKQGYSIEEIEKRSALSKDQIAHILKNGGQ